MNDNSLYISPTVGISLSVLLLLIGGGVGGFVTWFAVPESTINECSAVDRSKSYEEGFAAARKLVEESSIGGAFRTEADIRTLTGTVSEIGANRFILTTKSLNPFDDQALNTRTVVIGATTTIVALVAKDTKLYQSELDAFSRGSRTNASSTLQTPPSPVTRVVASIANIKVGDVVSVVASMNIKSLREFTAIEVQILTAKQSQGATN